MTPVPQPPHDKIEAIFDARIQTLTAPPRYYRAAARRFLAFLQTDFPRVLRLSELRRDPHLLGWVRSLCEQDPPLSNSSCRIYLLALRRLLHDFASEGHSLQSGLILAEDFPLRPRALSPKRDRPLQPELVRTDAPRFQPHPLFAEIFDTCIQTLAITLRPQTVHSYRVAARRFLSYLQTDFPQLSCLSELCRDPHLLGWLRSLCQQHPPLSTETRQLYLLKLQRLLHELDSAGHSVRPGLILPEDIPPRPRRHNHDRPSPPPPPIFQEVFDARLRILATTLRPATVENYRLAAHRFLSFLQKEFPQLLHLSQLRRDPHLFGWFRHLCQQHPPLSKSTRQKYLLDLRRLLHDLAAEGHPLPPGLILPEDIPSRPHYLPRALSPEEDQRLQQELRRTNDLRSNALLLTRATGIRIGECINLASECLRSLGQSQWALHVPLGKLNTERLVPVDDYVRQIVTRILTLRALDPSSRLETSTGLLLPRSGNHKAQYYALSNALQQAAERVDCHRVTCHRLRHTFATEMVRLGVSLPALMQLLGHKDIRMTLRYVQVTQQDLQRQFQLARQAAAHLIPKLTLPDPMSVTVDLAGIQRALNATRHLLETYRRQLTDEKTRRKLQRLDHRLLDIASQVDQIATAEK
jgi:site-specific recombinase XerD